MVEVDVRLVVVVETVVVVDETVVVLLLTEVVVLLTDVVVDVTVVLDVVHVPHIAKQEPLIASRTSAFSDVQRSSLPLQLVGSGTPLHFSLVVVVVVLVKVVVVLVPVEVVLETVVTDVVLMEVVVVEVVVTLVVVVVLAVVVVLEIVLVVHKPQCAGHRSATGSPKFPQSARETVEQSNIEMSSIP